MLCLASATQAGDKKCWNIKKGLATPLSLEASGSTDDREDMLADGSGATVARQGKPLLPGQWQQVSGVSEFKEVVAAEASMASAKAPWR